MIELHLPHTSGPALISAIPLVSMWFLMMAAMMVPVAWPWVVAFDRLNRQARTVERVAATTCFASGYAVAWLLYSIAAATVQLTLLAAPPPSLASAILLVAGLAQFSALKRACLHHCRHPFSYLLARWQNGPTPAWRIGLAHGLFCVGCCWALMATMLVVGMANVWWMIALTFATSAEQLSRHGELARVATGIAMVVTALVQFT